MVITALYIHDVYMFAFIFAFMLVCVRMCAPLSKSNEE